MVQVMLLTLLRGAAAGATEGISPLGEALLIGGMFLLLALLAVVVFWRLRRIKRDSSK